VGYLFLVALFQKHQFLQYSSRTRFSGNEIYPSLFQPFGRFPDSSLVENSYVTFPKFIGMGYEHKKKLNDLFKKLFK
jgi:hypothetical protein